LPTYWLLTGLIVIAAVLRFYKLGEWSFWGDEMFTVGGREDGFNYTFLRQSLSLTLIQYTTTRFGLTEWTARLVPALLGILSIPLLYFPVKQIFGTATALVVGFLLAISPWHLYWSQNARFYVALLLFYSLALFAFYQGLEKDRPWYLVLSLIFLGLAAKERLLALFFVPVGGLYLALIYLFHFEKPAGLRWRNLLIFLLPGLVLGIFFAGPYLQNFSGWLEGFGYANNNPIWLFAGFAYYVGLATVCLGFLGAVYFLRQKQRAVLLMTINALVPIVSLMAISPFHYTANRYAFISLISWLVLAGLAATKALTHNRGRLRILVIGLLLFITIQSLSDNFLYYRFQNGNRDNWRAAIAYVGAHRHEGDLVFINNPELGSYYLQNPVLPFSEADPTKIAAGEKRVWFIEDMVAREIYPTTHRWLQTHAQLTAEADVHLQARTFFMRVYLYEPNE
jgi:uncharacterized membrane protein